MIDRRAMLAAGAAAWAGAGAWAARARPPAPDLTGTWTNAWYTKLQRPKAFKALIVTPAEAAAYEAPRRRLRGELASKEDVLGQNESEFPDNGPGLARIRGEIRSCWLTQPADGRLPYTAAARKRLYIGEHGPEVFDNVEDRDTDERCLTNASGAAPLLNAHDANLISIVQTPGAVVIVGEKNHEARIVRLDGAPDPHDNGLGSWNGRSIGRWEGATLVVETTRYRPGDTKLDDDVYLSEHARVTERFTRTGPKEIFYVFEVDDPALYTQVWRGEQVFRPADGLMYEYACHEGNYALPSILAAARQGSQPAPVPAAKGGK